MMFYDVKITRHINNKGNESWITAAWFYVVSIDTVSDIVSNYVSGEYEITVKEHKENNE